MRIVSRLWNWIRRRKDRSPKVDSYNERREFVYLDEVSVLSILASRTGRIATESTESRSASHSSEVKGSIGVGWGSTKANLGSRMQAAQAEASQVSHKAIIQSSFKDLYDIERSKLSLHSAGAAMYLRLTRFLALKSCWVHLRGLAWWSIPAHSVEASFWKFK